MELKEFTKKAIAEIVEGVDEVSNNLQRRVLLSDIKEKRTIEFDVAVTVEENIGSGGKGEIKVLGLIMAGGGVEKETKSSTVSRIQFGVYVDVDTKKESQRKQVEVNDHNRKLEQIRGIGS